MMKPTVKTDKYELYLADCLDVMKEMTDKSVDAVFTSPPYNLGNPSKGSMFGKSKQGEKLEYNLYNDDIPEQEYIKWQHSVLKECHRIISDNGVIFYNHKPRIVNGIYDNRRNLLPYPIRQEIVWETGCKFNYNGTFFVPSTERIFIIAKGNWRIVKECVEYGEVWRIPPEHTNNHPATFPLKLAKRVVMASTDKGKIIFDPFMGSGTTGIACMQLGRKFIGVEIDPKYFEIAEKRIREAAMQDLLFTT